MCRPLLCAVVCNRLVALLAALPCLSAISVRSVECCSDSSSMRAMRYETWCFSCPQALMSQGYRNGLLPVPPPEPTAPHLHVCRCSAREQESSPMATLDCTALCAPRLAQADTNVAGGRRAGGAEPSHMQHYTCEVVCCELMGPQDLLP